MAQRRMLFATFWMPGAKQYVELVHPQWRFAHCGITALRTSLYAGDGREVAVRDLPLEDPVIALDAVFSAPGDTAMVLTDVAYELKGKKHPYQYGFLYQPASGATPIHYPLDIALGLTDAIRYSPNFGYFPLGPLPPWLGVRLYLGNVSEHASIEPEITLVAANGCRTIPTVLPPLSHRIVELPVGDGAEPIEYLTVGGPAKPICYVAGVDRRTGALTFLEHLMQTHKLDA
ncbi:MAG: hypothetical protein AB1411_02240 [Nitrospirota bacterium]